MYMTAATAGLSLTVSAAYLMHLKEVKLFVKDRLLMRQQQDLEHTFDALPSGVLILNKEKMLYCNTKIKEILKIAADTNFVGQ